MRRCSNDRKKAANSGRTPPPIPGAPAPANFRRTPPSPKGREEVARVDAMKASLPEMMSLPQDAGLVFGVAFGLVPQERMELPAGTRRVLGMDADRVNQRPLGECPGRQVEKDLHFRSRIRATIQNGMRLTT